MRRLVGALRVLLLSAGLAASGGAVAAGDGVLVLLYHHLDAEPARPGPTVIAIDRFERQMGWLAEAGYTALSLDGLARLMEGGPAPERPIAITFDDGWQSQKAALPILRRHGFHAAFFIFPGLGIGGPPGGYMSWADLVGLSRDPLFEVQAHSMTHPYAPSNNLVTWASGATPGRGLGDVMWELAESKRLLESNLQVPVDYFAWPGGWYSNHLIALARGAGFRGLLTAEGGTNHRGQSIERIRRVTVDGSCSLDQFRRILGGQWYIDCGDEVLTELDTAG